MSWVTEIGIVTTAQLVLCTHNRQQPLTAFNGLHTKNLHNKERAASIQIIYYNEAENRHSLLPDGNVTAGAEEKQLMGQENLS